MGLFVKLLIFTSFKTFHGLLKVSSCIHFQSLLFPLTVISGLNDFSENIGIWVSIGGFFLNQLFGNNLNDSKIFPHILNDFSTCWILIINDKSISWPCDCSVQEFQVWTKLSIIIDVLHNFFNITDNFLNLDSLVCLLYNALGIHPDLFWLRLVLFVLFLCLFWLFLLLLFLIVTG